MAHNIMDDEDTSLIVATVTSADPKDVAELITMPIGPDSRGEWQWVRLRSGELMLAVFPKGDTYMRFSDKGVCELLL